MKMEYVHRSVLLKEAVDALNVKPDGIYVDGTLGAGGHSFEICKRLDTTGRLIGIDQDQAAIEKATDTLSGFGGIPVIVRDNFSHIAKILQELNIDRVDGILLDLGVSSYQIDDPKRGFSYMADERLDMRMDQRNTLSAYEIVNEYDRDELIRIFRQYGEEKFAVSIANNIVRARQKEPIATTGELVAVVERSVPAKYSFKGGHSAKRVFQALRIAVNDELNVLESSVDVMIEKLQVGGRLCIITFHSLEDRIVKNAFRRNEAPCTCPPDFPVCVCGKVSKGKVITRRPIVPDEKEIRDNKRAKSAKLRVFERREGTD